MASTKIAGYTTVQPLATCALHQTLQRMLKRSPAALATRNLHPLSFDGLQSVVPSAPPAGVPRGMSLRRGRVVMQGTSTATGLTGTWKKDKGRSDSMDQACEAVQLSWVLRKALKLLSTLELEDTEERFTTRLKAGGIMDVVESYRQDLKSVSHPDSQTSASGACTQAQLCAG